MTGEAPLTPEQARDYWRVRDRLFQIIKEMADAGDEEAQKFLKPHPPQDEFQVTISIHWNDKTYTRWIPGIEISHARFPDRIVVDTFIRIYTEYLRDVQDMAGKKPRS